MTDYAKLKNQLQPLESSSIKAIGWEAGLLTVVFGSSEAIYCYEGVSHDRFLDLLRAKSPGKFFQAHIRGKFDETKVEPPHEENAELQAD